MPISGRLYPRSKGDASQPGSAGRHISGDACARHVDGQPGGAASRWGNRPGAVEAQELGLLRGIVSRTAQGDHAARTLDSAFLPGRGGGDGGGASALRSVSAERLSRVRAGLEGRVWQMARPQVRGRDPARGTGTARRADVALSQGRGADAAAWSDVPDRRVRLSGGRRCGPALCARRIWPTCRIARGTGRRPDRPSGVRRTPDRISSAPAPLRIGAGGGAAGRPTDAPGVPPPAG